MRLISRFIVEGESMAPTYKSGDRLLVSSIPLLFSKLYRGDIVIIQHPKDETKEIVKRIIGVAGDKIEGQEIGEDESYVLGDNKNKSEDSRHFGLVKKNQIIGKVLTKY